jgi:lipopolysaccharide transport system ATP-binding protein
VHVLASRVLLRPADFDASVAFYETAVGLARYREDLAAETRARTPDATAEQSTAAGTSLHLGENRFGSQLATIDSVTITDQWGKPATSVTSGEAATAQIVVRAPADSYRMALSITRDDGLLCLETSHRWNAGVGQGELELRLERLDLAAGSYGVSVGLYSDDWEETYDFHDRAYPLHVRGDPAPHGAVLNVPLAWTRRAAS